MINVMIKPDDYRHRNRSNIPSRYACGTINSFLLFCFPRSQNSHYYNNHGVRCRSSCVLTRHNFTLVCLLFYSFGIHPSSLIVWHRKLNDLNLPMIFRNLNGKKSPPPKKKGILNLEVSVPSSTCLQAEWVLLPFLYKPSNEGLHSFLKVCTVHWCDHSLLITTVFSYRNA